MSKLDVRAAISQAVSAVLDQGLLPPGWIWCEGQVLDKVAYHELYAVIGDTYTTPNALAFRVPDARGYAIKYKEHGLDYYAIGHVVAHARYGQNSNFQWVDTR